MIVRRMMVLLVLAAGFVSPVTAEQAPQVGHCNIAMAVMLHPLMAKIDTATGRFHSNALPNGGALVGQASVELDEQRKELIKQTSDLRQELAKVNQEFISKLHELNRERDKPAKAGQNETSPTPSTDEYSNRRRFLEHEHRQKIITVRERLAAREGELEKLNAEARLTDLLPVTDTERVFKLILDDVYEAANIVIEREKLAFTFNSATTYRFAMPSGQGAVENPIAGLLSSQPTAKAGSDQEFAAMSRLYRWATGEKAQLYHCGDVRLTQFVVKGGKDITADVVNEVYKKHQVPAGACDLVQKLFRTQLMK
ncbi:MAG TPA: hypothetical protein PLU72_04530 [Candidatus Ozemobacteraceae bacterium]|nr:hypothetical protein [Candidatus Ozemobacteraceae bacterium]HQG26983.1 hypothetical protein [Candidatus Ozemobacteraceae bacterium]